MAEWTGLDNSLRKLLILFIIVNGIELVRHKSELIMILKTPRVFVSRHGIYYFRYIDRDKNQRKISLRTRDPETAKLKASGLNFQLQLNRQDTNLKIGNLTFKN